MARRAASILGMSAALLSVMACDAIDEADDVVAWREGQTNGFQLNGFQLNGFQLNGFQLNGFQLNGPALSGDYIKVVAIDLKGSGSAQEAWVEGSDLHVLSSKKGAILSGAQLEKATIAYDLQDGGKKNTREVKITKVTQLAPGSDIWLYDAEIKEGSGGWQPLCRDHLGAATKAIVLPAIWDPETGGRVGGAPADAVTFACRDAALAKCVEFGYRPWASAGATSLREHHQACTRMLRADYCGEGLPHTVNGTPIHVLDAVGVQKVDPQVQYVVEAEWGPDGATCLNAANTRHPNQTIACDIPACGASFSSGGLIQSGKVLPP